MSEFENTNRASRSDDARVLKSRMRITAIQDGWIQLQGDRTASCSACAAKSGCGIKGLSDIIHQSPPRICAQTDRSTTVGKAAVGDEVIVSISGNEFVLLTMLAYLLPAAALAATACLGQLVGLGDGETAILALITFTVSFLPLRWRERADNGLTTFTIEEPRQTGSRVETKGTHQNKSFNFSRKRPVI